MEKKNPTNQQVLNSSHEEEGPLRYLAYLARFRTLVRYLAYTSDVGEAFRPIAHPRVVTAAYGISWTYVVYDVSKEGYEVSQKTSDKMLVTRAVAERAIFQSVASMLLPAITIHTTVDVFKHVFKRAGRFQKWGPTVAGLAVLPFLPYMFDYPVEHGLNWAFNKFWPVPESAVDKEKKH
jgi:fission process protein 1